MDKITSFTINHLKLLPGIYVVRLLCMNPLPFVSFYDFNTILSNLDVSL